MKTKFVTIVLLLALAIGLTNIGSARVIAGINIPDSVSDSEGSASAHASAIINAVHNDAFTYKDAEAEDNVAYAYSANMGGDSMELNSGASVASTGDILAFGKAFANGDRSSTGMVTTATTGPENFGGIESYASAEGGDIIGYTVAVALGE